MRDQPKRDEKERRATRMADTQNAKTILVSKRHNKRRLGRSRRRWKYNIQVHFKTDSVDIGGED